MNKVRSFIALFKNDIRQTHPTPKKFQSPRTTTTTSSNNSNNSTNNNNNSPYIDSNVNYQEELNKSHNIRMQQIEDNFINDLDYIMAHSNIDEIIFDKKYLKKLFKISELLKTHGKVNRKLFTFLEYSKVVEHLVYLLGQTIECNKVTIVEHYGRKQNENYKAHKDHNLIYCLKANHVFYTIISIIYSASFSKLFCKKFNEKQGINILINYLADEEFISDCVLAAEIDHVENRHILDLLKNMIIIVKNLTRTNDLDSNMIKNGLISFSQTLRSHEDHFVLSYIALSKHLSSYEIDCLPDKEFVLKKLINLLQICSSLVENKKKVERIRIESDNDVYLTICLIKDQNLIIDLIELIEALHNLNIEDYIKNSSWEKINFFDYLKKIILHGNDIEAEYVVKLLLQLSFDSHLAKIMLKDEYLKSMVKQIILYQYPNKKLIQYSECLIWSIENLNKNYNSFKSLIHQSSPQLGPSSNLLYQQQYNFNKAAAAMLKQKKSNDLLSAATTAASADEKPKILISFESFSSDRITCIKIKRALKSMSLKVWLKDENFEEYKLEENLEAIAKSDCILICTSKKYKMNPKCRLEAEYANELRKPIVPLLIQNDYFPDGWLESFIEDRPLLDFTKIPFQEAFENLVKELSLFVKIPTIAKSETTDLFILTDDNLLNRKVSNETKTSYLTEPPVDMIESLNECSKDLFQSLISNDNESFKNLNFDIVLSSHSKDEMIVHTLKESLENMTLDVWSKLNSNSGVLRLALKTCKCILICYTKEYQESSSCEKEIQFILNNCDDNKFIVLLKFESIQESDNKTLEIIKNCDLIINVEYDTFEDCLDQLKDKIEHLIKSKTQT